MPVDAGFDTLMSLAAHLLATRTARAMRANCRPSRRAGIASLSLTTGRSEVTDVNGKTPSARGGGLHPQRRQYHPRAIALMCLLDNEIPHQYTLYLGGYQRVTLLFSQLSPVPRCRR